MPRLGAAGVSRILSESRSGAPEPMSVSEARDRYGAMISYGASGGARSISAAGVVQDAVRTTARAHGFPEATSQAQRASFDTKVGAALCEVSALESGEGMRGDVWAFISVILLPDVVAWRFPDLGADRFKGGIRNALQRCWMRARTLDLGASHADRWKLLRELSEDALVQIFERASLANDLVLARSIAEVWADAAEEHGRGGMEDLTRSALKTVRLRNEIVCLGALPPEILKSELQQIFEAVRSRADTV